MLIRFEVENFRSIADPVELSMIAVDRDRSAVVPVELLQESLLKVSAIYGPNASGKSNVVAALAWLRAAFPLSLQFWDDGIPCDPFAFGDGPSRASRFALEMTVDGVRFEYQLELTREKVIWEALYHYPHKVRRKIFERDGQQLSFQRGVNGLGGTKELLTERSLVVSIAQRYDRQLIAAFYLEVVSMNTQTPQRSSLGGPRATGSRGSSMTLHWFDHNTHQQALFVDEGGPVATSGLDRKKALSLLQLADLGIADVLIEREEVPATDASPAGVRRRMRLLHYAGNSVSPLEFDNESEGTKSWFSMIGPVLDTLRDGSMMVIDELDASLHPTLSAALIGIFQSADTNPNGAQLLFTSHDTSLLDHLNRDEVWLTEKDADGKTRLGSLAEFAGERVRKSVNLKTAYLGGKFGALPDIDQPGFVRALELAG